MVSLLVNSLGISWYIIPINSRNSRCRERQEEPDPNKPQTKFTLCGSEILAMAEPHDGPSLFLLDTEYQNYTQSLGSNMPTSS